MNAASTSSVTPFACAERISARPSPYVTAPLAGRAASFAATSDRPIAAASVSMCAASESSASEPARIPATTSAAMKPTISASASASLRASADAETRCSWPCPWWAMRPAYAARRAEAALKHAVLDRHQQLVVGGEPRHQTAVERLGEARVRHRDRQVVLLEKR